MNISQTPVFLLSVKNIGFFIFRKIMWPCIEYYLDEGFSVYDSYQNHRSLNQENVYCNTSELA